MSALTRPSGPLPARVYWIRRGIVLLVALLLVVLFAKVLGGGSDGKGDADARAEAASGEVRTSADDQDEPAAGATGQRKGKGAKAPLADPDGDCDPADVTITPLIKTVANDGSIDFEVAVTGAEPACTWTFSRQTVALKITSGRDEVWSSQQCRRMLPEKDLVVRSGVQSKVALTWDGRRSDDGCTRRRGWAQPGYYHAVIAAMGGEPTDVQFRVTPPPTEVVTVTPKPRPAKKSTAKPAEPTRRDAESPTVLESSPTGRG
jgi:hypothetical protein